MAVLPTLNKVYIPGGRGWVSVLADTVRAAIQMGSDKTADRGIHPTVVRDVLVLPAAPSPWLRNSSLLLDVSGRRVLDLQPGPNDVSRFSPGVYFLRSANSGRPSAVQKVIVTR